MSKCIIIQRPQRVVVVSKCFGSRGPQGIPGTPGDFNQPFETVAAMLLSTIQWSVAECSNYNPGDGTVSIWIRARNASILPNGTNIQQTADGRTVMRIHVAEGSGSVTPGPGMEPYIAGVPIAFPTSDDFRNSLVTAPFAIVLSPRKLFFEQGDPTGPADDVNNVTNAAGVTYRRWRPE